MTPAVELSRYWKDRLAHYREHTHPEHIDALVSDTVWYAVHPLEPFLKQTEHWGDSPVPQAVGVLLWMADRGILERVYRKHHLWFEAVEDAEARVGSMAELGKHLHKILELIWAVRQECLSRNKRDRKPR